VHWALANACRSLRPAGAQLSSADCWILGAAIWASLLVLGFLARLSLAQDLPASRLESSTEIAFIPFHSIGGKSQVVMSDEGGHDCVLFCGCESRLKLPI
jgi:hypothetical protein